jgi:hypothetical protein
MLEESWVILACASLSSNVGDLSLNRTVALQVLYGLSSFGGIEERCQVERRIDLHRSIGLFVSVVKL